MYTEVGDVPEKVIEDLKERLKDAVWKDNLAEDRYYKTWFCKIFEGDVSFFMNIPPGGFIHKHADTPKAEKNYHIPVYTNDKCENWMYPDSGPEMYHLEVGKIYDCDRQVIHDSRNLGETDRIHLILETCTFPKFHEIA